MNAQAFLEYVVAAAVIILAIVSIGVGIAITLLVVEVRRILRSVQKTAHSIENLKDYVSSGIIGSIVSLGKNIFQNKPRND